MGALTSNRKRGNDHFSSNSKTPFSNISKKLKFSSRNSSIVASCKSSTVERYFKYPDPINPIRREVHGPCRKSRFGYKQTKGNLDYSGPEMGNSTSRKYEESKRSDFDSVKKDIEVINIDDNEGDLEELEVWGCEKSDLLGKNLVEVDGDVEVLDGYDGKSMEEVEAWGCGKSDLLGQNLVEVDGDMEVLDGYDGKSIEEVEAWGYGKSDLLGQNLVEVDEDVEVLDGYDGRDSSVVTGLDDGNLREESVGKMIESLDMNPTSDSYFYVPLYKKLLGSVEKISKNLKRIQFQIGLNEMCLETNRLLRFQKKGEQVKEDVITEPFVPLTEEEQTEVSRALSKSNWRRVLVTHRSSNIDITGEILQCLRPGQWLNDEVINVYLDLLKEREKREPQKFLKCHFFSTFFYKKLISGRGGYNYQSVRRWTSQRKLGYCLLECDKIFVPIHKEIHWCLAVINKKDKKFQYLDSLRGRDSNVLKVLARYFVDEVKDKSGQHIDVSSWKQEFVEDLPEQKNGYDCGVFMIKNADFYSRDIGLCFNQGDMPYFRSRTAKEILRLQAD